MSSALDRDTVVQAVTDAGTELTTAAFGAFFYNVADESGDSYMLYTTSGVARDVFAEFPNPRNTPVFAPTFRGDGPVRSDDITKDPRYGHNHPHRGMPPGHLPVRSYLAVPVKTRSGEVLGGLFFGHPDAGRFTDHHERLAIGTAAWASVALENSRLYLGLQDANRLKDEFLATLSHELRTPLNAILGYANMIKSGAVAFENQQRAIDTIERNARSLAKLVEDVLDVSRIISGRCGCRSSAREHRRSRAAHGGRDASRRGRERLARRNSDRRRPSSVPGRRRSAAADRVEPDVECREVHAARRTASASTCAAPDCEIEIVVCDNGIGIAAAFLPHVFERFRQEVGIRRPGGLGRVEHHQQLVELHGGTIAIESEGEGKGAYVHGETSAGPRFQVPRSRFQVRVQVPGSRFWNLELRTSNSELWNLEPRTWNVEPGTTNLFYPGYSDQLYARLVGFFRVL